MEQTYPIYEFATQIGTLSIEADGLYLRIRAIVPDEGKLIRIYLVGADDTVLLGTALPNSGQLVCERKLSRHHTPKHLLGAISCCEQDETWQQVSDQWQRMTWERVEFAQPYEENEPVEQIENYTQLQPQTIEDQPCLVRSLSWAEYLQQRQA